MQYPKRTVTHEDQQIELAIAPMEDTSPRFSGVGDFIICGYVTTQRHKVQSFEAVVEVHQINEDDTTTRRSIDGSDLVFDLETALCRVVGLIDHEYRKLQDELATFDRVVSLCHVTPSGQVCQFWRELDEAGIDPRGFSNAIDEGIERGMAQRAQVGTDTVIKLTEKGMHHFAAHDKLRSASR